MAQETVTLPSPMGERYGVEATQQQVAAVRELVREIGIADLIRNRYASPTRELCQQLAEALNKLSGEYSPELEKMQQESTRLKEQAALLASGIRPLVAAGKLAEAKANRLKQSEFELEQVKIDQRLAAAKLKNMLAKQPIYDRFIPQLEALNHAYAIFAGGVLSLLLEAQTELATPVDVASGDRAENAKELYFAELAAKESAQKVEAAIEQATQTVLTLSL